MSSKSLFGRVRISRKLVLICLSFSLPLAVLLAFFANHVNGDIRFTAKERDGNLYQRPLEQLLRLVPDHETLAASYLSGQPDLGPQLTVVGTRIDETLGSLTQMDEQYGVTLQFTEEGLSRRDRQFATVQNLRTEWLGLKTTEDSLKPEVSNALHDHLIVIVQTMITHLGDTSNLILDPELPSYYLVDTTLLALPENQARLASLQVFGVLALSHPSLTAADRTQFAIYADQLQHNADRIQDDGKTSVNEDKYGGDPTPSLQRNLPPAMQSYGEAQTELSTLVQHLSTLDAQTVPVETWLNTVEKARHASFSLWQVGSDEVDGLLAQRQHRDRMLLGEGLLFSTIALTISLGLAWITTRNITEPLQRCISSMDALSAKDLTARLEVESEDEIGHVAVALNSAISVIREAMQTIANNATSLSGSSTELSGVNEQMAAAAEQTSTQAQIVSKAADHMSRNLQTVAAGTEEMGASINEIAKNASEAAQVANTAVTVAGATNESISRLGESSAEIGKVVRLITAIAEKTNLLAVNATIEAARAGEAGRGFGVVATEVKDLARQTATATEEIASRIETIQVASQGAAEALGRISSIVVQISHIQNAIATAVEQQSATTSEMSRNVHEAARRGTEISLNIVGVADAARTTTRAAFAVQTAASQLAQMAPEMEKLSGQFKYECRLL